VMEASVAGFQWESKQMLRDSRGDGKYFTGLLRECIIIAVLDFYDSSAPTNESDIHFFHVHNLTHA